MRNRFAHPYHTEHAEIFIADVLTRDPVNVLGIEIEGKIYGTVGIFPGEDVYNKSGELGYCLSEEHWGHGIATEAVKLFLELYVAKNYNLTRVYATVFGWNPISRKVLEKNGFVLEGIGKNAIYKDEEYTDEYRYAKML